MRVKIHFVLTSRPKAQKPTNNLEVGDLQPTPLEVTPEGGMSPGKMVRKAKLVSQRSLETRLMTGLMAEKVGTFKIECQALEME